MTAFVRVKNFEQFQHYKNRCPPWIKLHSSVLADYTFSCLQDASKAHLMLIWVLASACDNKIRADAEWIARRIGANEPVDLKALLDSGFLEVVGDRRSASKALAASNQPARERRGEERRDTATWLTPFGEAWTERTKGGMPSYPRLAKALKPVVDTRPPGEPIGHWKRYLTATEPRFLSVERFVQTYGSWAEPEVQVMTDDYGVDRPHRRNAAGEWEPVSA